MFGLLNIDKPPGITSRDVVNRVQRAIRPEKVGHAGTLDPLATGVLVVAVGPATRLVEYVQQMPKTYRGTFVLGQVSDTEDVTGKCVVLEGAAIPSFQQIFEVLPRFQGVIEQRPPAFSAVKIAGQRAYALARRGEEVPTVSRPIEIFGIEIIGYEYPQLELLVRCGSGTYVRSLGRDLAVTLGTGAVMSSLRRLAIGPFTWEQAIGCEGLTWEAIEKSLLPPALAVSNLPAVTLSPADLTRVFQGQRIANLRPATEPAEELAALDEQGNLAAILTVDGRELRPSKCFVCR